MAGRIVDQQFVSQPYAFAVPLPGAGWQPSVEAPALLTLTHPQLQAGMTVNVTCHGENDVPLDILARHLFFGFKNVQIVQQTSQVLQGVSALRTEAQAQVEARPVRVLSYVIRRDGCVYDLVYFASPQDYARGEAGFESLLAGFRFLGR